MKTYVSPQMEVFRIELEGVICASTPTQTNPTQASSEDFTITEG